MTKGSVRALEIHPDFIEGGRAECGYRNLWAEVIRQAIRDSAHSCYQAEILRWLGSWGFKRNCEILELEPDVVATKIRQTIAKTRGMPEIPPARNLTPQPAPAPRPVKRAPPRKDGKPRAVDLADEILKLRDSGCSVREIGTRLGFSGAMVSRVLTEAQIKQPAHSHDRRCRHVSTHSHLHRP